MPLRVLLGPVLALALLATLSLPAGAASSEEDRLDATRARIAAVRSELEAAKSVQSRDAAAFAKAERQLAVVMEALSSAEQAVQRQQAAVDDAKAKLRRLEDAENRQREAMTARAVSLYKQGAGTGAPVASLLGSDSPRDAMRRSSYVDAVNRSDQESFEQVTITQTAIAAQRKQLAVEQESLERVAAKQREIALEAEAVRNDKALALAATSDRVRELQSQENHLTAESRQIAALARRAAAAATVSRSSTPAVGGIPAAVQNKSVGGGWTWPASGPVTSEFGYRWGRAHEGLDIGAPTGAPIWAAAAGTVTYASSMSGYGNMVLVDHGGGIVTAYAHQSAILVGVGSHVSAGQQIGRVGSTGNSTGPHLHFEVRVGGSARNPRSYLP